MFGNSMKEEFYQRRFGGIQMAISTGRAENSYARSFSIHNRLGIWLVAAVGWLSASHVEAATINLGAQLSGDQEVPSVETNGFGLASMFYDTDANTFNLTTLVAEIGLGELADNPGRFHIHMAPPGVAGPIIVPLGGEADFIPVGGGVLSFVATGISFPEANEADLLAGNTYLNLHTTANPGGEIRGQLIPIPEPASIALLGIGFASLAGLRRRGVAG